MNSRNRRFVLTIAVIPSAIFGIGYYFVGRDFAFSVASLIATVIIAVFGVLNQETKTTDYLMEHSQTLIKEVDETWFVEREVYHSYSEMPYKLVFFIANYGIRGSSQTTVVAPKHLDQIDDHLSSGYRQLNLEYIEAKKVAKEHLERVIQFWEKLEEIVSSKVAETCPTITEWDVSEKRRPLNTLDLRMTVNLVYLELIFVQNLDRPYGHFQNPAPTKTEQGEFWSVGQYSLNSTDREIAMKFLTAINEIIYDKRLQESVRRSEEDKRAVYAKLDIFKKGFEQIKDDFEHGHQNLKGSCPRCKQLKKTG